ncbi:MAG: radical SAM protein [Syntrophaceae bacterium]
MLKVNEIFYSIQGESSYAGRPCVFVRLTGCNLRCSYCDTRYAYEEGQNLTIGEIVRRVTSYQCRLVEITGGEPLIQKKTFDLIYELLENNFVVILETNGSIDISPVDKRCVKIVDVKCPSSGEVKKNYLDNLKKLSERDEIKFVIGSEEDYLYAKKIMVLIDNKKKPPILSPVYNIMDPKRLAEWVLADHIDVRIQIQLHKIIWGPEMRGV